MSDEKDREAARLASELLEAAGLRPRPLPGSDPFADLARPDRAASARRREWVLRQVDTAEPRLSSRLIEFLSKRYSVPAVHLGNFEIAPEVIALLPRRVASDFGVVPLNVAGDFLVVAMEDPSYLLLAAALSIHTGFKIEPVVALATDIDEAIDKYYGPAL